MIVLRTIVDHGFPDDYLFARVRARRAALASFGRTRFREEDQVDPATGKEDDTWYQLQEDLLWCFCQMNSRLRAIFHAFFIFMELRTLLCCIRYQAAAMTDRIGHMLRYSLLSREIRAALIDPADVTMAVSRVAASFGPGLLADSWHKEHTEKDMLKRFESALFTYFLQQAISAGQHAELTFFFRMQIDVRNVMLVAKHRRWAVKKSPFLLPGGLINQGKMSALTWQEVFSGSWAAGLQFSSNTQLEGALLKKISASLTRRSRLDCGISLVLDYLWQRYLAARNASLLNQAATLPSGLLNEELIQ